MTTTAKLSFDDVIITSNNASDDRLVNRLIRNSLIRRHRPDVDIEEDNRNRKHVSVPNASNREIKKQKTGPSLSIEKLWKSVTRAFSVGPVVSRESTTAGIHIQEDSKYALTRPELMDDDLDIDYAGWKKRACCHQFSNPKLEKHFWTFYVDNHTNTIRIVFIAFLAFPILGWISVDYVQKVKSGHMFWNILWLRMVWSLFIVAFLLFFEIGRNHVGRLDSQTLSYIEDFPITDEDDEDSKTWKSSAEDLVQHRVSTSPWYKRIGAITVYYTSQCVFAVSFVSCVISILISYMGNEPNHKPYIILFIVMHIFLGLGNNFCSFLCWITTVMFCIINFLLVESPYKTCGYVVGVSCILTVMGEFLEFSYRKLFYKRRELELEQFKNDIMLTTVVPPRIALQLKRGEREAVSYTYEKPNWGASVLFCQICDFEQLSNDLPAAALVNYLNKVFTYMDRLSTQNKVYKVETVKEVYMAACGLPQPNADHMNQIAHFALDIKEFLIDVPERLAINGRPERSATLKIGIHCGTVIAGVIGKLCPRYRLFGDTVNVAARMETNSEKGKIQITERFKTRIDKNVFKTVDRGFIKIKGKDSMHTHFLAGRTTKNTFGEGLCQLTTVSEDDDKGISILKFCFDNGKLDADVDLCDVTRPRAKDSDKLVRYKSQRTFSFNKIGNRSFLGSLVRGSGSWR